eukprot:845179-Amphidinium_carterae.2
MPFEPTCKPRTATPPILENSARQNHTLPKGAKGMGPFGFYCQIIGRPCLRIGNCALALVKSNQGDCDATVFKVLGDQDRGKCFS